MNGDVIDADVWPDDGEPHEVWVEFAVKRGFKRSIVEAMTKPALIECLNRLESYDNPVY